MSFVPIVNKITIFDKDMRKKLFNFLIRKIIKKAELVLKPIDDVVFDFFKLEIRREFLKYKGVQDVEKLEKKYDLINQIISDLDLIKFELERNGEKEMILEKSNYLVRF
jgi:hypothetical protein